MKKLFSVVFIIILLVTFTFTGCSKKSSKETDTSDTTRKDVNTEYTKGLEKDADVTATAGTADSKDETFDVVSEDQENGFNQDQKLYKADGGEPFSTEEVPCDLNLEDTEEYSEFVENGFLDTTNNPLSTFSIDVDTASYANLRKSINYGSAPDPSSVRIEEMLNYFSYDYEEPSDGKPFSINTEIGKCPWNEDNYLLMVGIQGKNVDMKALPKNNLVFLIDVSGSMDEPDKLPLLKNAFSQLVEELGENDRVSIVVYAGSSGVVLDSARGDEKEFIRDALDSLSAGGSTAGAEGIDLAYNLAEKNFIKDGNNRVILATDGDFNVGPSSLEELEEIISDKKESGIFLSVMGFGTGNIKDNRMELLADKGNGNYSYIDSPREAKKVLVDEMSGTLLTIAKDVKIQLEFNPYSVESYRLIGYENRALENEDFDNDKVDAGELGAGHNVTAIYEVIPGKASRPEKDNDELKYQSEETSPNSKYIHEISEIRLRYKEPDQDKSEEIKKAVTYVNTPIKKIAHSDDFYFAAAVAEFGMILRYSEFMGNSTIDSVLELSEKGLGEDPGDYRKEFRDLVEQYEEIMSYRW